MANCRSNLPMFERTIIWGCLAHIQINCFKYLQTPLVKDGGGGGSGAVLLGFGTVFTESGLLPGSGALQGSGAVFSGFGANHQRTARISGCDLTKGGRFTSSGKFYKSLQFQLTPHIAHSLPIWAFESFGIIGFKKFKAFPLKQNCWGMDILDKIFL